MDKMLLHTCCAGCGFVVLNIFKETWKINPSLFFFNPNIQPLEEYHKRKEAFVEFTKGNNIPFFLKEGNGQIFLKQVSDYNKPNRCLKCYSLRLSETFLWAAQEEYSSVSTTLLASPYQYHQSIKEIGEYLAKFYNIPFFYYDFRKQYFDYVNEYKKMGYYLQNYCGCEESLKERDEVRKVRRLKRAKTPEVEG